MVRLFPRAAWRLTALSVALISLSSMAIAQQQQQPRPAPAKPAAPAATPAAAPKQPPGPLPTPMLAVVDIDRIRQNAVAAKSVRDQLNKFQSTYQDEFAKLENDLRNAGQDLDKQRTVLSPEAFAQRRQQFEQRVAEGQRSAQARKKQLNDAFNNSMLQLDNAIVQVIQDVATARGANLMLPRSQIILSHPSMEVTDEVLDMVNRKLPTVKVTLPPLTQ
jgi:Skp family chaperone for outer membrane proteins